MGLWSELLRVLGLSGDARVHISAPGIDVVITGKPEQVRSLLGVVKYELERSARWKERVGPSPHPPPHEIPARIQPVVAAAAPQKKRVRGSQVVLPTELDEMDSPYALPEALVMPVDDTTGERALEALEDRTPAEPPPRGRGAPYVPEMTTLVPDKSATDPAGDDDDEPEAQPTAVTASPSGATPAQRRPSQHIVVPNSEPELPPLRVARALSDSDAEETKETTPRS
ncbi:hypothetical protein L6R52_06925 [Myxococcota bacterium]|nr:hypothetical protein [Myxococcota bacterium]